MSLLSSHWLQRQGREVKANLKKSIEEENEKAEIESSKLENIT